MYRDLIISAFIVCLFVLPFAISRDMDKFVEEMERIQKDIEKKYKHLMEKDEHGYYIKVSEEQAKLVFSYIDQDRNNFVDKDELVKFGKLTVSNNTESAEIWADTALLDDKNGDQMMSFEEFHRPLVQYGERYGESPDERHQHKDGHLHENDPMARDEL